MECPGDGAGPGQTECVGGQCVQPSCVPPDPTGCEGVVLCGMGAPCAVATASCAEATCEDGVCLALPIEGACESAEYCLPDDGGGCRTPGEEVAHLCNTICTTDVDAGCETGYWNCTRGEPFCDPFLRRPVGDECSGGVCDGAGRCVDCAESAGCARGCARGTYRCDAAGGGARCELDGSRGEPGARCSVDGSTCVDGQPCATDGLCSLDGVCVPDGTPGVIVGPEGRRYVTSESGRTDQLTVQLTTEPLHPVAIDLTTDEPREVAIEPASVLIAPGTATMPRVITLRGLDDGVVDDARPFVVRFAVTSDDARYDGLAVPEVGGINLAVDLACAVGTADCDGLTSNACEADLGSDETCGGCGVMCAGRLTNGAEGCAGGSCALTCDAGFASCDDSVATGCETDVRSSLDHCGGCDQRCAHTNASSACSGGACTMGACAGGFGNCDGSVANGCETDVSRALDHCGGCGQPCAHANASSACSGGVCSMGACERDFGDCDGSAATGCETDLTRARDHCGACGNECSERPNARDPACVDAQCTIGRCNVGWLDCNQALADGCELEEGAACAPEDAPCHVSAVLCAEEFSRPICRPLEPLPAGTRCFDRGMCDGEGLCLCDPEARMDDPCGPEHACNKAGVCARNVHWVTVDCASGNRTGRMSGDELCQSMGYARARSANGWWWEACGGPNGSTEGVDNCVEYDPTGTRCLSFCTPEGRNVDCAGTPLCEGGRLIERVGRSETVFDAGEFTSCERGNPGWSVRVECVYE